MTLDYFNDGSKYQSTHLDKAENLGRMLVHPFKPQISILRIGDEDGALLLGKKPTPFGKFLAEGEPAPQLIGHSDTVMIP